MSTETISLVNKLILLVLVMILVCLVVLIAKRTPPETELPKATVAQSASEETPDTFERPKYLPLTNRTAPKATGDPAKAAASRVATAPPAIPHAAPHPPAASPPATVSLVNLPPRSAPSAPGSAVTGGNGSGAEIAGYVWLTGAPPPEMPIHLDATCGRLHTGALTTRHYLTTEDGRLANVFVYVKSGLSKRYAAPTNAVTLDNVGCLFEPYILGAQAGQKIHFRNSDPFLHNVHVTARSNREFNYALPARGQSIAETLRVPEVFVRVKCDVHPWMFAYIGVVAHPFFAVTDAEGLYRLPAVLPPGTYTIVAHHVKAGEVAQEITIGREGVRLDFSLAVPPRS